MSTVIKLESIIPTVNNLWSEWQKSNFTEYSPGMVPIIVKEKNLQKVAKNHSYNTITKLVNGKNYFR